MERTPELTTVESWERLWAANRHGPTTTKAGGRPRAARSWDRLLAGLLDSAGTHQRLDVLELGCAPGWILLDLHRLRPQHNYRGIDYAPAGLATARERLDAAGMEVQLHLGDIRDAVIPPADLVLSFGLVEHFAELTEAIGYHRRFLAPGGTVGVTVPNYSHPLVVSILKVFSPDTLATHNLAAMSTDALRTAFLRCGLTDVRAGECGPAILPNSRVRPDPLGRSYRFASQVWNYSARLGPERWPWPSVRWAVGKSTG